MSNSLVGLEGSIHLLGKLLGEKCNSKRVRCEVSELAVLASRDNMKCLRLIVIYVNMFLACYSVRGDVLFVDDDASINGDGQSWSTAYRFLQDALSHATTLGGISEIRVGQGIYMPDDNDSGTIAFGDRNATFALISGVSIKGGFAGVDAPDPNARDNDIYASVLSGDLAGNDLPLIGPDFSGNIENSYHVVTGSGTDRTALLDGFTIVGGFGQRGAGMSNIAGNPTVVACNFSANAATETGGGVMNEQSNALFHGCVFDHNVATHNGGAMYNVGSSPEVSACDFIANESNLGGAIFGISLLRETIYPHSATIYNCVFRLNSAGIRGGAIFSSGVNSHPTVVNCTFGSNSSQLEGGAVYVQISQLTLSNSVLWNNSAPQGPEVAVRFPPCEATIRYCNVRGGQQFIAVDPGAKLNYETGNINANPLFENFAVGDFHLSSGSPCIDSGDDQADIDVTSSGIQLLPLTDFEDNPRLTNCHVDLGAFEFQGEVTLLGDFSEDCSIDLDDFLVFEICSSLSGPGGDPIFQECRDIFDFDGDEDVDLADFAEFQIHFSE